jgi:hypothetical protein
VKKRDLIRLMHSTNNKEENKRAKIKLPYDEIAKLISKTLKNNIKSEKRKCRR